jgi:TetR/AcrR family transcriptional regulator, transcriptional repressor for nem operon
VRDGERTREHIIERAAVLFNQQGYSGASMSDIMAATGLQKGGIYRHFGSKEQLALEAFDYAVSRMAERFREALEGRVHAVDRLAAVVEVYAELPVNPPVPGGCPVMNTAIESDSVHPALRERAQRAMDGLRALIRRTTREGISRGEVRAGVDAEALATLMISALEGGVMLSMLYGDPSHARSVAAHLTEHLDRAVRI